MHKYKRSPTIHTTPFLRTSRMHSRRRLKVLLILFLVVVATLFFWTHSSKEQLEADQRIVGDFYYKTKSALENNKADVKSGKSPEDEKVAKKMSDSLKEAAQVAKDNANAKAPKPDAPSDVIGKGSAAEGAGRDGEKGLSGRKKTGADGQKPIQKEETKEDHEVETELNLILKKSPIIIFSKSYCPHSKRAKDILLDKYIIDPKPYVVELDHHPLGLNLQGRLAELTNRRTVPNVLINGISIGGGDDIAELDALDNLISKIKELGDKKIREVKRNLSGGGKAHGH